MRLVKLYCGKCEEMMPVFLHYLRGSYLRNQKIAADCTGCGKLIRELDAIGVYALGATLHDVVSKQPAAVKGAPVEQIEIPVVSKVKKVPQVMPKVRKIKPGWLQDKIKKQYAKKHKERKRPQTEIKL